ncbi:MAG: hypothetical protein Alpg2KO_27270 [Alphaproteobacteria bacterium]
MGVMTQKVDKRWVTKRRLGIAYSDQIIDASRRDESVTIDGREYQYVRDMSLSQKKGQDDTTDAGVFVDQARQHVVIAFEGTDKSQFADLVADIKLWAGLKDRQFEIAEAHTRRVMQYFGEDYSYEVVGHSLGASQAAYVSGRLGVKSTGLSDPGLPQNFLDKCDRIQLAENSVSVQVDGDPISGFINEPKGKIVNLRLPDRKGAAIAQRVRDFFAKGPSLDHPEQLEAWQTQRDLHNPIWKAVLGGWNVFDDKHDNSKIGDILRQIDGRGVDLDMVVERLPPFGVIKFDGRFDPDNTRLAHLRNQSALDRLTNPDSFERLVAEAAARAPKEQCPLTEPCADDRNYAKVDAPKPPTPSPGGGMMG